MAPHRIDQIRKLVAENIRAEHSRKQRRRKRLAVIGTVGGTILFAGIATGAALIIEAQSISNRTIVHCLSSASRNFDGSYPGSSATIEHDSGQGRVEDAVELCSEMWKQGAMSDSADPLDASPSPGVVPRSFTVCVMRDGSAAVVPTESENVCDTLGLAPLKD